MASLPDATDLSPSDQCVDCNESIGQRRLTCQVHLVCKKCLIERIENGPSTADATQDEYECTICVTPTCGATIVADTSDTGTTEQKKEAPIWIYVDDSNIWIEAKKHVSKVQGFKTKEDHRVRIDIGKLTKVVADGRPVAQGFLYGSEPPAVDTVWEKIKKEGWKVTPKRRSRITRKEKKVDTQLVADVTERACIEVEKSTFVLITGDADAIPGIDVALKYNWKVEVVMWKHAISADLRKYEKKGLKLRYLDDYLEKVTFTNWKFQILGNEHLIPNLKESGIVLKVDERKFPNYVPSTNWCKKVEAIAQWPFQYYWIESCSKKTNDLLLFFKRDRQSVFDIEEFMTQLDDYLDDLFIVDKPVTYLSYDQDAKGILSLNEVRQYEYGEAFNPDLDQVYASNNEGDGQFQLVEYDHRHKKQRYSDPCQYKFNCRSGRSCHYKHTEEELAFFRDHAGKARASRKVKLCNRFPSCPRKKEDCFFAHGEEDAWCLICCDYKGHFTDNCPDQKKH